MRTVITFFLLAPVLFALFPRRVVEASGTVPAPLDLKSPVGKRVHLVELFSSEGCSSCPPAEAWMAGLKSDPRLWTEFVPVEFHVDYWNHLGWVDRFSKNAFTTRENEYASAWGRDSVYTPARVIDGFEWDGSDWGGSRWISDKSSKSAPPGRLRALEVGSREFEVSYADSASSPLEVTGVLLGRGLSTEVRAGENAGRTLRHEFVALSFVKQPLTSGKPVRLTLPAPPETARPGGLAVAFWVSRANSPVPLQAVGGELP